jgi:hypothetical protein
MLLRMIPCAAVLAALVSMAQPPKKATRPDFKPAEDAAWTSRGFAEQLQSAAERARTELREAPEIAWADVRVRSIDDHAPLRVEASVAWSSPIRLERKEALLSALRSRFESFACVDVVLSEPAAGDRTR